MDAMLDDSNTSVGAAVKSPILSDRPDKITKQVVRGINRAGTPTNLKPFTNDIAKNRDALLYEDFYSSFSSLLLI